VTTPQGAIIPRWELRTFAPNLETTEAAFAALTPVGVQDSDELYLLSPNDASVKIRDDLMDIKVLEEVDAHGLERWRPVMKAPFPLPAADLARVFGALGAAAPALTNSSYTREECLDQLAHVARLVPIHKHRVRYKVAGCSSEVSDVLVEGQVARSIAIEGEDQQAVVDAVRSVGLTGYVNTNYPRGLAWILAGSVNRYAVIDVGTNSVKLHVGEAAPDGTWRPVLDRAEVTRLGEGLAAQGTISDAAMERTAAAIHQMRGDAIEHGALAIAAVGTAGLRAAGNSQAVLRAILARTGIEVEVISGEEEARLAYEAVVAALPAGPRTLVVFDTGGGSSQFTFGTAGTIEERFSLEVGAARYTERFRLDQAVSDEVVGEVRTAIATDLARLRGRPRPDALVGMGGANTNLTAVKLGLETYDPARVQGAVLDVAEIERQIALYRTLDADARRSIVGLQPKRAEVILAGACIVRTVMAELGCESLTVSDRGLRHGLIAERFGIQPTTRYRPGQSPREA
jgi:exopolyphosphatase/guanosine-5'-triphosphate,3'-diphosphate pyrophosphatase